MVLRDLDIMFDAPDATATTILTGLTALSHRVGFDTVDLRDERTDRRPTPRLTDARFYAVLRLSNAWKVDLTFWLHVIDRPHVADALRLRDISEDQRRTILRLKFKCPGYPETVSATDIYTAVLEHGVRTLLELDNYLSAPP
jgi:hypothetical protein